MNTTYTLSFVLCKKVGSRLTQLGGRVLLEFYGVVVYHQKVPDWHIRSRVLFSHWDYVICCFLSLNGPYKGYTMNGLSTYFLLSPCLYSSV